MVDLDYQGKYFARQVDYFGYSDNVLRFNVCLPVVWRILLVHVTWILDDPDMFAFLGHLR